MGPAPFPVLCPHASLPVRTPACDCICDSCGSPTVAQSPLPPCLRTEALLLSSCPPLTAGLGDRPHLGAVPSSLWLSDSLPTPFSAGFLSLPSGPSQPPSVSCRVSASSFLSCPHPRPSLGLSHLNWVSVQQADTSEVSREGLLTALGHIPHSPHLSLSLTPRAIGVPFLWVSMVTSPPLPTFPNRDL